jgi:ParB family chromosome partitioning protein
MAKVKYKRPVSSMDRMIIKTDQKGRSSLGMTEVRGEVYYLSPNLIIPYHKQARKKIKEGPLMELESSIRTHGIIQPLQVIPAVGEMGKFEVISGERRLRAALKIGLKSVPCMLTDKIENAEEIALIENIQRENLHPIELSDAISILVTDKKHGNQKQVADRIGISKQQISHLMAISRMPPDVKTHLLKTDFNITQIKSIAYLSTEAEMRVKVFNTRKSTTCFKSILRLSSDGLSIRYDQNKVNNLNEVEKKLLKTALGELMNKI